MLLTCTTDAPIQKAIHFAARLVTGLRRFDHVSPALAALGWPGIYEMVEHRATINVYRALYSAASPESLRAALRPRSAVSSRMTRAVAARAAVLELARFRLTAARRLFPYRAAASWYAFPAEVIGFPTLLSLSDHFKHST